MDDEGSPIDELFEALGRFERRFHRQRLAAPNRGVFKRLFFVFTGLLIVVIGLALVPLPGPGWLIVFGGLFLIAGESRRTAVGMDRLEAWVKPWLRSLRRRLPSWFPWSLREKG